MDQVILYDKSLQNRLQEYTEIFPDFGMNTSDISQQWRNYLEMTLDPNGWQAVWKIPRNTCESLKILFPTVVLVYVENVNFSELKVQCRIIAVQDDDIHLPEFHYVPLMEIWVTKEQDKSVGLNISSTANVLDMYRFFYTNIFLAWDVDEDVSYDWLGEHLQSRVRLFYDVKNGVIPHAMGEHIKSLVTESKRLQNRREDLENKIMDHDIDADNTNDKLVEELMELNVNMIEIKNEMDLLENPMTRAVVLKRQQSLWGKKSDVINNWLIVDSGTSDDYITLFKMLQGCGDLKVSINLQAILDVMNPNDTIFLNKNLYQITSSALLQYGGTVKSLYDKNATTITTTSTGIMFDFTGNITLENVTLNASCTRCAILCRQGKTTLKNCHIIGDGTSTTQQAIIVLNGAEITLIDCIISDFCTAIVGNTGSKVTMENSEIYDVNYGIRMYDDCIFKANKSVFRDCQQFGISLETTKMSQGERKVGCFELLEVIPEVSIKDLDTHNNKNGDVVINQKQKISPIKDLFSRKDCSDEEMETTVIEKVPTEGGDNATIAE